MRIRLAGWAVAAALLLALPADAARLEQVRVGDHSKYTRIVLEFDGPAEYGVEKNAGGGSELRIGLDADAAGRVLTSRSRLVESVTVRPGAGGSEARVKLRRPNVTVREMVLKNPYRIVLDVSPAAATAAAPAPKAVARAPEPAPAATPTPAAEPEAPEPSPAAEPAAAEEDPAEAALAAAVEAIRGEEEGADSEAVAEAADSAAEEIAQAAVGNPEADAVAEDEETSIPVAVGGQPPEEPQAVAASGDAGFDMTWLLAAVAVLLVVFLVLRRRSERFTREAAATPWPPPGAEERPEYTASRATEELEPHVPGAPETAVVAEAEEAHEPDPEPDPGSAGDEPALPQPAVAAAFAGAAAASEPEVVAKEDARVIEELERRIERLEARLSDTLDARERLERQMAAHTEELRVQRAAIARTQRALRAAVKTPESSAEMAP